ncbi:MAG: hypothetical protein U0X75_13225 [Acidobacteriota bacterium]
MLAGIPNTASAITISRFALPGLQAIAQAAEHIMVGSADVAIGGGIAYRNCRWADTICHRIRR